MENFLIQIARDEKLGRFLRATREISARSVVISELPCVVGQKWNSEDEDPETIAFSCVGCFEPIKILHFKCPSCFWPACSPDCIGLRTAELHDIECALLRGGKGPANRTDVRTIKEYFRTDAMLALKILLLQRKNPKKFKALMEMESNEKNRLLSYNYREAEDRINYLEANFLNPLKQAEEKSGQVILPLKDKKTLHKIFGIIETNAMYISLSTGTEICGLFPTASLLQHSCVANCGYYFDMKNGFKIMVEAARDIKTGESLSTTYSHVLWSTQLRLQHLKDAKYFSCSCERCKDPTELGTNFSTLRCVGTEEGPCNGFQLPTNPTQPDNEWACNKCPVTISNEHVSFITGRMNEEIEAILSMSPSPKVLEDLIEKLSQFLHPTHQHMFSLKHAILQLYGTHKDSPMESLSDELLHKKLQMCNELLQVAQTLDPYSIRIPIYTGILIFEKFNAIQQLKKRNADQINIDEAKICLEEAKKILRHEVDSLQGKQLIQKIDDALVKL